jgi:uncharacterized protein YkwD
MSRSRQVANEMIARWERLEPRRLMSAVEPTAAEQYMLELVNQARANPAAAAASLGIDLNEGLSPGTISAAAKQPLAFNPDLISAAREHSTWMIQNNTFAHNEGNVDPGGQMSAAGYPFTGSYSWGQNISFQGETPATPPVNSTVAQEENSLFVDSSEPGRGHRLNILDPNFKEIGVGVETGTFQGYNAVLTTQDFAYESGDSFLTGVAFVDSAHTHFYAPGEGLGGVTVTATRQSDNAVFTTTTWSAGGYTLALPPGTYNITATGGGIGTVAVNNTVIGSQNVEVDFTPGATWPPPPPASPGWATGTVFRDRNGNGIRDAGEGAIAQWRVFVDLNNDGVWKKGEPFALTNARGIYRLKLAAGNYTIRAVARKGFANTSPATGEYSVTISSGVTSAGLNFGEQPLPVKKKLLAGGLRKLV